MIKAGICLLILASCGTAALAQQSTPRPAEASDRGTIIAPAADAFPTMVRVAIRSPWEQVSLDALACDEGIVGAPPDLAAAGDVFVVRDGFVFVRLPGTGFALPMPGGGASGCIDPDSVQRGYSDADLLRVMAPACGRRAASRTAPN